MVLEWYLQQNTMFKQKVCEEAILRTHQIWVLSVFPYIWYHHERFDSNSVLKCFDNSKFDTKL